jgi:hypothetical protein
MQNNRKLIRQIQNSSISVLLALVCGGCASSETQVQKAAKDWCMTIRGSQVIPVYPLTEDIQPGDIFLVQVPIEQQQRLYKQNGFLALDNLLGRLNPTGYDRFYDHSFFAKDETNDLPRDWIRPSGTNQSWQLAPHAGFPSYSFSVRHGAGLNLAVPVQGVPVGLSLLASSAASGTIQIEDAHTIGVDTISLYQQVVQWAAANQDFLNNYATPSGAKARNYLRIVSRVYATGRMTVSLKDASSRSGGVDGGVPKPVDLLTPVLSASLTNTAEVTQQNFTNGMNTLSQLVQAAGAAKDAAGKILPGGSLRLTAASASTVSIDETFASPLTLGYLGFDCVIEPEGRLGPPIPTHANLNANYQVTQFENFRINLGQSGKAMDRIKANYLAADAVKKTAIRQKALDLGLTPELVADETFIVKLNRALDPGDPVVTQKFKALADFSAAP